MLTGGADPLYRRVLASVTIPYARIDVFNGSGVKLGELKYGQRGLNRAGELIFFSGSVSATLSSRVARTLNFTVHESLYPVNPGDLLAPYGNFIRAYAGVLLGDGNNKYVWQVFEGRIQDTSLDSAGTVTVACSDRAADVIDNGFTVPQNSSVGVLAAEQIRQLITDGFPGATFGTFDTFGQTMPQLTWESDRGSALDEIAQSLGAFWYPLANADFVLRKIPWTVAGTPVVTFADGDNGSVAGYRVTRSRSEVYNIVTVTGERSDGTAPVYATARDTNTASPTYYLGDFGQRTRNVHLQTPATQGAVQGTANDLLRSTKALTESWEISTVPDASLELGDVVDLAVAGRTGIVQVVSGFQLPLDNAGAMSITMRSQIPGLLEVE